ncbi:hypothetical protein [Reinekea marinisedimentorum]|uniref:Peptidase MA superfamily protein n=1 Tax=Reinekea marinisedimentorum TaxID=230495 RepID=A0A4R3IB44_9GAMM|nr:hypothetical protein [Reinekea marinisedimentorum]TCS43204.1 hypothetical protein BCF53_102230 [Reinekea marinisedimentorum]
MKRILTSSVIFLFSITAAACSYFKPVPEISPVEDEFQVYSDSRILYKQGMEEQAGLIASVIDSSIQTIEQVHQKPFTSKVTVHICDTPKCFARYTKLNERISAAVYKTGLFLSPRAFENNRYEIFLTHELSHLHLFQQIPLYKTIYIPQWFHEGLAVYASNGGGADFVSEEKAITFLAEGKHIMPLEKAGLFGKGGLWGNRLPTNYPTLEDGVIQQHMSYRQSALFVKYLNKDKKVPALLRLLENGDSFKASFERVYGVDVQDEWNAFTGQLDK